MLVQAVAAEVRLFEILKDSPRNRGVRMSSAAETRSTSATSAAPAPHCVDHTLLPLYPLASGRTSPSFKRCPQILEAHWFGDVIIHAGLQASFSVALHSIARNGDEAGTVLSSPPLTE